MTSYYPPVGFHFKVEFGIAAKNDEDTRFQEVSGLNAEMGIDEISEGGENRFSHRLPNPVKYSNLVLKRGLLTNSKLISWLKNAIENFEFEPTTVNITLLNERHQPVGDTYSFINVWPVKWSISDFKSQENAIVIETLELAYSYFSRTKLRK